MSAGGIAAYVAEWEPAARQAAGELGIPWQWVLAQWGVEYGFANGPQQGENNPADLRALPGQSASAGGWANFSSVSEFVDEYVRTVRNDFPWFQAPTVNPTPADVFGSQADYTTSQSAASYTQAVLNAIATLGGSGVSSSGHPSIWDVESTAQAPVPLPPEASAAGAAAATTAAKTIASAAGDILKGFEGFLARAGVVLLGLVLAAVGVFLLVFSERETIAENLAAAGAAGEMDE